MKPVLEVLRGHAASRPAAPALCGGSEDLGYGELLEWAVAISEMLARRDIRVLALAADNSPDWVAVDFAAQIAGIALVPLPAFFSAEQLRHVMADSGADAVIVDAAGARRLAELAGSGAEPVARGLDLRRVPRAAGSPGLPAGTAKISYTSGTTGKPKGVCLTQTAMDHVAHSLCVATADLQIDRHLCALPLATLLENIAGVYAPVLRGAAIALPGMHEIGFEGAARFDLLRFLDCLRAHAPQSVILLPQMLAGVVAAIERGAPPPASLRFAAVGGGVVAASVLERADRLALPIYEGYGLTECASVVALNSPGARRIGSVGRPLQHAAVRIDANGQILVSGAATAGYVGAPPNGATEIATGDLGYLDRDGFLHVKGRSKNVFITSFGRNVSPDWVEAELVQTGRVAQAAVFGEARPWNVAVIVPAGTAQRASDIQAAVDATNARLPDYARILQWVPAAEPFTPANSLLTDNGRNRRAAIWQRYRSRIDACYDECIGKYA